jgi:hypothetical protein
LTETRPFDNTNAKQYKKLTMEIPSESSSGKRKIKEEEKER